MYVDRRIDRGPPLSDPPPPLSLSLHVVDQLKPSPEPRGVGGDREKGMRGSQWFLCFSTNRIFVSINLERDAELLSNVLLTPFLTVQ